MRNKAFRGIFRKFLAHRRHKVVFVGSADRAGKPNAAPKMLVDIAWPNTVYFIDYRFTKTHRNLRNNPRASLAFMDDRTFTGFRLGGICRTLKAGPEFRQVRLNWENRLNRYLASRIVDRVKGDYAAGKAEMALPQNFIIMKFTAREAAVVEPDRVLRSL